MAAWRSIWIQFEHAITIFAGNGCGIAHIQIGPRMTQRTARAFAHDAGRGHDDDIIIRNLRRLTCCHEERLSFGVKYGRLQLALAFRPRLKLGSI